MTQNKILWAVACESAEIDAQGRVSANRIMNAFWVDRFPCVVDKMCIFGVATGTPNSQFELAISVVPPGGMKSQLMTKQKRQLGPSGSTPFQVTFTKIGFPAYGKYSFHLTIPGHEPHVVDVSLFQAMPSVDSNKKN